MPSILSVATLQVEPQSFTTKEKQSFKHLNYHLGLPKSVCKFIIIANTLKDKSIYNIAVEMKKRNSFNLQNFYRMITRLRNAKFISISKGDEYNERYVQINPSIHSILSM